MTGAGAQRHAVSVTGRTYYWLGRVSGIDLRPLQRVGRAWAEPMAKTMVGRYAAEIDGDSVVFCLAGRARTRHEVSAATCARSTRGVLGRRS